MSFDVLITDDNILESDKVFNLTIDPSSLPRRVTVTDPSQAVVTIIDNESECICYSCEVIPSSGTDPQGIVHYVCIFII